MADVRSDMIAVYLYRRAPTLEFLQLRRTSATGEYQHSWQIVYGGIEAGETASQAAIREIREETGLAPLSMFQAETIETFYFRPYDYVTLMPVFGAEVAADAVPQLNEEHDAYRWIAADDIDTHFMWRTQRECVAVVREQIERPGLATGYLTVRAGEVPGWAPTP
jgi:dATP pyrophosphohydrolase